MNTARLPFLLLAAATLLAAQNRIVSTTPAITETLFALGLGSRVVGVSTYCHYPPEATTRTRIGTYLQPNLETILRLKPDLVIMEKLAPQTMDQLQRASIRIAQISTGDLATNLQMIEDIGRAAGAATEGKALRTRVEKELGAIRSSIPSTQTRRKVIFIVGRATDKLEGIVASGGRGSYLNELIAIAGGVNVLADSPLSYPKVSLEAILRLRPDVIIDMGDMADTVNVKEEHKQAVRKLWSARPELRNTKVEPVASDIYVVPGPRMVDAARAIYRIIHEGAR